MPITLTENITKDLGEAQVAPETPGTAGAPVETTVVETPAGEMPQETTVITDTPAAETSGAAGSASPSTPAPAAEAAVQPSFEQLFEEKSGGRFKNYDDVVRMAEELEQLRNQPKPGDDLFADENLKLLNGFVKLGKGTFTEGLNALTKDFAQMDKFEVLRAYSELKEPYLTPEQREFAIQEIREKLDPELNDEKAVLSAQIQFEREVNQKRGELSATQSELINNLRNEIASAQPQPAVNQPSQADIEAATQRWRGMVDQSLGGIKELTHDVKDAQGNTIASYKFAVDEAALNSAKRDAYLGDQFTQRYASQNPDGSVNWDRERFFNDMLWLANKESIINSFLTQAKSTEVKNLIGQVANAPAPSPQTPPAGVGTPKDPLQQAAGIMLGRR
jgi:hypothetical protein